MINEATEKSFDDFMCIETMEYQEEESTDSENSIYQASYYADLIKLFNEVSMEPEDVLVDYGCGLGRVLFYANTRHYCRTTGIEIDEKLYNKLLENASSYQKKFLDQEERMHFYNVSAEDYEVSPEDNFFYFFNPFSAQIFRKVLNNIITSVKRNPRDVEIMLYYPTFEYLREVRDTNIFVQKKIIKMTNYNEDPDEKVYVFHLSKYFVMQ